MSRRPPVPSEATTGSSRSTAAIPLITALSRSSRNSWSIARSRAACSSNACPVEQGGVPIRIRYPGSPAPVAPGVVLAGSKVTAALFRIRLTDASTTPGCSASERCTRDWQEAQCIPVTRSSIVSVAAIGRLASGIGGRRRRLRDHGPSKHAHAAHELVLPRFGRGDLDGRRLAGREKAPDAEIGEHYFFGAGGRVAPVEEQPHRFPCGDS